MKIFPDISYFALRQMAQHNVGARTDESDDERNCVNDDIKEDEEFSTYFSDNQVDIPENTQVCTIDYQ